MPYEIAKSGSSFVVRKKDRSKVFGTHPTKEKALAQLRALYANTQHAEASGRLATGLLHHSVTSKVRRNTFINLLHQHEGHTDGRGKIQVPARKLQAFHKAARQAGFEYGTHYSGFGGGHSAAQGNSQHAEGESKILEGLKNSQAMGAHGYSLRKPHPHDTHHTYVNKTTGHTVYVDEEGWSHHKGLPSINHTDNSHSVIMSRSHSGGPGHVTLLGHLASFHADKGNSQHAEREPRRVKPTVMARPAGAPLGPPIVKLAGTTQHAEEQDEQHAHIAVMNKFGYTLSPKSSTQNHHIYSKGDHEVAMGRDFSSGKTWWRHHDRKHGDKMTGNGAKELEAHLNDVHGTASQHAEEFSRGEAPSSVGPLSDAHKTQLEPLIKYHKLPITFVPHGNKPGHWIMKGKARHTQRALSMLGATPMKLKDVASQHAEQQEQQQPPRRVKPTVMARPTGAPLGPPVVKVRGTAGTDTTQHGEHGMHCAFSHCHSGSRDEADLKNLIEVHGGMHYRDNAYGLSKSKAAKFKREAKSMGLHEGQHYSLGHYDET